MTWIAEVRHVLAKDVRQFRWMLALYFVFILAALVRSAGWAPLAVLGSGVAPIAVILSGMIIIASTVQADSPIRANAFWATHPLRPSVVAGAKVGFAMLLVAMGLVAQAIAMTTYDLGGTDFAVFLVASAAASMCWLIVAMVIAAITRELPAFLLAILALPVLGFTLVVAFMKLLDPDGTRGLLIPDSAGSTLRWLAVLGGIGIIAWLYRRRDARRRTRVLAVVFAVLALYAAAIPFRRPDPALPPVTEDLSLALEMDEAATRGREIQLAIMGREASTSVARRFESRELTIRRRDDSIIGVDPAALSVFEGTFTPPPVPALRGVRWIGHPVQSDITHRVMLRLPSDRGALTIEDISTLTLTGRMIVSEPQALARMPVRVGAETVNDGYRIRVDAWVPTMPDLPLAIAVSLVDNSVRARMGERQPSALSAALINERRGEGFVLRQRGAQTAIDGLVLPGVPAGVMELRYERRSGSTPPNPDADWLRDAELVIFRDIPVGAYPVRLEHIPR